MFRAFYTPIIRSTISTVSTASGTNHSIISATFFQRGLVLMDAQNHKHKIHLHTYFILSITSLYYNSYCLNPLNTDLNPICHLLALLEAHHIFHISRIRVNICIHTAITHFNNLHIYNIKHYYCFIQSKLLLHQSAT